MKTGIILGSDSDLPKVRECFRILEDFKIEYEVLISSAHRTPEKTREWTVSAEGRGIQVIIAVAGGAAHLPGVVASHTGLPVIGVPVQTEIAGGLDSILSINQMPSGIPVATMPAGKAGGTNAALFALRILALKDEALKKRLNKYMESMRDKIEKKNADINSRGLNQYIEDIEANK